MKILLVEDDENKRTKLLAFLRERCQTDEVEIAKSLQGGVRAILRGGHELIIVDMTMPTFDISAEEDGGRPQAYAGREILRQMDRRGIVVPTLVVTQFDRFGEGGDAMTFDELDGKLKNEHPGCYVGMVYYDVAVEGWREDLAEKIAWVSTETGAKG